VSQTASPAVVAGAIDCDVHCAPSSIRALTPYLSEYWREYISEAGVRLSGLPTAYPPGAPTSALPGARRPGRPAVPDRYEDLAEAYLDRLRPRVAILNCLALFETHRNPYYAAAVASAINDWLRDGWLDRDHRLRASLVVSTLDVESAVAEIERLGHDRRFVQILLPVRADAPYGNRRYHPILEAAVRHGLVVGIHAWGRQGAAATPSGHTTTYLQEHVGQAQLAQVHLLSLVSEGVFARFPGLRVSLLECGFTWLPALLWRFDKDWRSLWREVPWVRERPSEYVRRHVRLAIQPAHPPTERRRIAEVVETVGAGALLYASDHPHDHGPGAAALLEALDDRAREEVLRGNAARFYRLHEEANP
jgi:predicted TIM-barrel fold metal-dependent hydrolase